MEGMEIDPPDRSTQPPLPAAELGDLNRLFKPGSLAMRVGQALLPAGAAGLGKEDLFAAVQATFLEGEQRKGTLGSIRDLLSKHPKLFVQTHDNKWALQRLCRINDLQRQLDGQRGRTAQQHSSSGCGSRDGAVSTRRAGAQGIAPAQRCGSQSRRRSRSPSAKRCSQSVQQNERYPRRAVAKQPRAAPPPAEGLGASKALTAMSLPLPAGPPPADGRRRTRRERAAAHGLGSREQSDSSPSKVLQECGQAGSSGPGGGSCGAVAGGTAAASGPTAPRGAAGGGSGGGSHSDGSGSVRARLIGDKADGGGGGAALDAPVASAAAMAVEPGAGSDSMPDAACCGGIIDSGSADVPAAFPAAASGFSDDVPLAASDHFVRRSGRPQRQPDRFVPLSPKTLSSDVGDVSDGDWHGKRTSRGGVKGSPKNKRARRAAASAPAMPPIRMAVPVPGAGGQAAVQTRIAPASASEVPSATQPLGAAALPDGQLPAASTHSAQAAAPQPVGVGGDDLNPGPRALRGMLPQGTCPMRTRSNQLATGRSGQKRGCRGKRGHLSHAGSKSALVAESEGLDADACEQGVGGETAAAVPEAKRRRLCKGAAGLRAPKPQPPQQRLQKSVRQQPSPLRAPKTRAATRSVAAPEVSAAAGVSAAPEVSAANRPKSAPPAAVPGKASTSTMRAAAEPPRSKRLQARALAEPAQAAPVPLPTQQAAMARRLLDDSDGSEWRPSRDGSSSHERPVATLPPQPLDEADQPQWLLRGRPPRARGQQGWGVRAAEERGRQPVCEPQRRKRGRPPRASQGQQVAAEERGGQAEGQELLQQVARGQRKATHRHKAAAVQHVLAQQVPRRQRSTPAQPQPAPCAAASAAPAMQERERGGAESRRAGRCYWMDRPKSKLRECPLTRPEITKELAKKLGPTTCCHDCQRQHPRHNCTREGCNVSYCIKCIRNRDYAWLLTKLPPKDVAEFQSGVCPKCLDICTCKKCLGKAGRYTAPEYGDEARRKYAAQLLLQVAPSVARVMAAEDEQAARDGVQVESVAAEATGDRVLCDRCATSIPCLVRHCPACKRDLCSACSADAAAQGRRGGGIARGSDGCGVACPKCGVRTELVRVLPDSMLAPLRRVGEIVKSLPVEELESAYEDDHELSGEVLQQFLPGPCMPPTIAPIAVHLGSEAAYGREMQRLAAARPPESGEGAAKGGGRDENSLFAPSAEALADDECLQRRFRAELKAGRPVVVRGMKPRTLWDPDTMKRAVRQTGAQNKITEVDVLDCTDWTMSEMKIWDFFEGYKNPARLDNGQHAGRMFKLKDFPPDAEFKERLVKHHMDFLRVLPMPEYSHPEAGPLNLAAQLDPAITRPTDLGPKSYIAYGRPQETSGDGDSVTKLHMDMSDAVNVLCHVQRQAGDLPIHVRCGDEAAEPSRYGEAGAVWDIWRRCDVPKLRAFLDRHLEEFTHHGRPLQREMIRDVIHDQRFMLTDMHREMLLAEEGVQAWTFEQHEWEGVVIPAGCPHQVRNLKPCIKVAVDFVCPESVRVCLDMADAMRQLGCLDADSLPPEERQCCDKLQARLMLLVAAAQAATLLTPQESAAAPEARKVLEAGQHKVAAGRQGAARAAKRCCAAPAAARAVAAEQGEEDAEERGEEDAEERGEEDAGQRRNRSQRAAQRQRMQRPASVSTRLAVLHDKCGRVQGAIGSAAVHTAPAELSDTTESLPACTAASLALGVRQPGEGCAAQQGAAAAAIACSRPTIATLAAAEQREEGQDAAGTDASCSVLPPLAVATAAVEQQEERQDAAVTAASHSVPLAVATAAVEQQEERQDAAVTAAARSVPPPPAAAVEQREEGQDVPAMASECSVPLPNACAAVEQREAGQDVATMAVACSVPSALSLAPENEWRECARPVEQRPGHGQYCGAAGGQQQRAQQAAGTTVQLSVRDADKGGSAVRIQAEQSMAWGPEFKMMTGWGLPLDSSVRQAPMPPLARITSTIDRMCDKQALEEHNSFYKEMYNSD